MEQKINVAEILKDCPKGMELNCVLFENATFEGIKQDKYPIIVKIKEPPMTLSLTKTGGWNSYNSAKCVIYPKGKTTWEGFVPPYKFKDGDVLFVKSTYDWLLIYKESGNDVDLYKYVSIPHNCSYNYITYDSNPICCKKEVSEIRLATEEEKKKLFDAIKENGHKWNAETKTLEKLPKFKVGDKVVKKGGISGPVSITGIGDEYYYSSTESSVGVLSIAEQDDWELVPNKFDITTLVPFDSRVLVRDNNLQKWSPAMWEYYDFDSQDYPYKIVGGCARYCIPYEGNEHLLGTTNDCDEYYKNW